MGYFHGVRTEKLASKKPKKEAALCGIIAAVGTAPVNQVESFPKVVLAYSFAEAKAALGFSYDWESFTLCEVMQRHFNVQKSKRPLLLINVADTEDAEAVEEATYTVVNGQVTIPENAVLASIQVKAEEALTRGEDFEVLYNGGKCTIEAIPGGRMDEAEQVQVCYKAMRVDKDAMKERVIGGHDTRTGERNGMEALDSCYAVYQVCPDTIIAPGFSEDKDVAAAMAAKATVSTVFHARAIVDADAKDVRRFNEVKKWKKDNEITDEAQILCWPQVKTGKYQYHMSTAAASHMAAVDSGNENVPSESPSNKEIQVDALVLEDGTELLMHLDEANALNENGICTCLNFAGGFRFWGNHTACYPEITDADRCLTPVARMMDWVQNSVVLRYWEYIDRKLNRRLCESIADGATIWMNNLTTAGHLYGGRVEFVAEENPDEDILNAIIRPHIYFAPQSPAEEIDFLAEYDYQYMLDNMTAE